MSKELYEMTLEELWKLFPIILTEHQDVWSSWYDQQAKNLSEILPTGQTIRISHIGSTSVAGIYAKPIIDILVELATQDDMSHVKSVLLQNGWVCMSQSKNRISFNLGYTKDGFAQRVFHLHLRYFGDNDELYFRDYLRAYPKIAKEYEQLKLCLQKKYEHNRDAYTEAKTDFITFYTRKAKELYKELYS